MSPWAKFPQIARALRDRIISGELRPGAVLPSEAQLRAEFGGVSRNTIRRALAELEREGLIGSVPAKGRVVRARGGASPVDERDAVLEYRKIAADLRGRIERGELLPGDPLPSEAEAVDAYGVSRTTVVRAFACLREAGLITSVHGKGRFVRSRQGT